MKIVLAGAGGGCQEPKLGGDPDPVDAERKINAARRSARPIKSLSEAWLDQVQQRRARP